MTAVPPDIRPVQARTRPRRRTRIIAPVRRRFGLRTRLTLTFGLGAALLSAVLSVVTFGLTRENLISQRERSAVERAAADASRLPPQLPEEPTSLEIDQFLRELPLTDGSSAAVSYSGNWYTTDELDFADPRSTGSLPSRRVLRGRAPR